MGLGLVPHTAAGVLGTVGHKPGLEGVVADLRGLGDRALNMTRSGPRTEEGQLCGGGAFAQTSRVQSPAHVPVLHS